MECYFLDKELCRITPPIDTVVSLRWNLRFYECGRFRAVLAADSGLAASVKKAEYLLSVQEGGVRCGRIDSVEIVGGKIKLEGRLPECLLSDHLIEGTFRQSGRVNDAVVRAVSENCRELPLIVGEDSAVIDGSGVFSVVWENLGAWVYRVLKPYGASCRVDFDSERSTFVFRVVNPERESRTVFSASFGNIWDAEYCRDSSSLKNKVSIEGKDGKMVCIDISNGAAKKEVYRKAEDLSLDLFETVSEYAEALVIRAKEVLSGYESGTVLRFKLSGKEELRFERDYQMGDFCYAADEETGRYAKARIVGADEVWENGGRTIRLSLML